MVAHGIIKSRDYCRQWEQAWARRGEHRRVPASEGSVCSPPCAPPRAGCRSLQGCWGQGSSLGQGGCTSAVQRVCTAQPFCCLLSSAPSSPLLTSSLLRSLRRRGWGNAKFCYPHRSPGGYAVQSLDATTAGGMQAGRQAGWMDVRRVLSSCRQEGSRCKLARAVRRASCKGTLFWVPVL